MLRHMFSSHRLSRKRFFLITAVAAVGMAVSVWAVRQGEFLRRLRSARFALKEFDADKAVSDLTAAEKLLPRSPEVEYLLGVAMRKAGRLDECRPHLDTAHQLGWPANEVRFQSLLLAFQAGDQRAEPVIKQIMSMPLADGLTEDAYEALTIGYLADYRTVEAGRVTDLWLHLHPRRVRAMLLRAEVFGASGRIHEQFEQYEKVLAVEPDNYAAHLGMAHDLLDEHNVERALEEYLWCAKRKAGQLAPLLGVAACYEHQAELQKAADVLRASLHPSLPRKERAQVTGELGKLLYQTGELDEAITLLSESVELNPYDEETEYALSMSLVKAGKPAEAQRHNSRFKELEKLHRQVRAIKLVIANQPHDAQPRYEAGLLLLKLGKPQGAAAMMLAALSRDPRHTGARMELAKYYHQIGRDDLARDDEALTAELAGAAAERHDGGL